MLSTKSTVWSSILRTSFDGPQDPAKRRDRRRAALEGENHVVGVEGIAVGKLHALAQMKPPERRLENLPALRQRRLDLELLVELDQRLHDVADEVARERVAAILRIERQHVALEAPPEHLGVDARRKDCNRDATAMAQMALVALDFMSTLRSGPQA